MGDDEVVKSNDAGHGAAGPGEALGREAASDTGRPAKDADALKSVDLQAYIGRQLRAVYDDVARQPVPDRFLELMKKLESTGG